MATKGGGDLIIGSQPLDDYLRPLSCRLSSDDQAQLLGLLAKYEGGVNLTSDETAFVFDKAKEIALSFF